MEEPIITQADDGPDLRSQDLIDTYRMLKSQYPGRPITISEYESARERLFNIPPRQRTSQDVLAAQIEQAEEEGRLVRTGIVSVNQGHEGYLYDTWTGEKIPDVVCADLDSGVYFQHVRGPDGNFVLTPDRLGIQTQEKTNRGMVFISRDDPVYRFFPRQLPGETVMKLSGVALECQGVRAELREAARLTSDPNTYRVGWNVLNDDDFFFTTMDFENGEVKGFRLRSDPEPLSKYWSPPE